MPVFYGFLPQKPQSDSCLGGFAHKQIHPASSPSYVVDKSVAWTRRAQGSRLHATKLEVSYGTEPK